VSNGSDPKFGHKKIIDGMLIDTKLRANGKHFSQTTKWMLFNGKTACAIAMLHFSAT
jgi:hypothetical protein